MGDDLLTPDEVASRLKISKYTVYEMVKRGDLPAVRIGRKMRFNEKDLAAYITQEKIEKPAEERPSQETFTKPILFMGSHDIAVDCLVDEMNRTFPGQGIIPAYVGSMDGLLNLYFGKADLAGCHLFDEETQMYNIPYVKRILSGEDVQIIHFVKRNVGWIVQKGNPKQLSSWNDLARKDLTFVNRQKGSGTRVLLDHHLNRLGLDRNNLNGYQACETTHYAVAAKVLRGDADFALGTESAAIALGLDFIQLSKEHYDLVLHQEAFTSGQGKQLMEALSSNRLKEKIDALGGYDTSELGTFAKEEL